MHGRKRNRSNKLHRPHPRQQIYRTPKTYNKVSFSRIQSKQPGSKLFIKSLPTFQNSRELNKGEISMAKTQEDDYFNKNSREYENVNKKIENIQHKISQEIQERKEYIQNKIYEEDFCFKRDQKELIQLKEKFIDFLLENKKFKLLERRKTKKRLENIRFNLSQGKEDVLLRDEGNFLFGSEKLESLIEEKSSEWNKWKELIELVSSNIEDYKFSLKKKELDTLYEEYERLSIPRKEENVLICEKCGSENLPKAVYCHYCGHELDNEVLDQSFRN